jgi:hypothetical protein
MIKLMNDQHKWESIEYTHVSSDGGTVYTLNHNFGKTPDLIECYTKVSGLLTQLPDVYLTGSNVPYGWIKESDPSINQSSIRVYRNPIGGSTFTLVIRCFNLGTTQTITNITPAFQWSTSEQVYPFEKDSSGNTLYCKQIDCGAWPNNGSKNTAHGISNFDSRKIHRFIMYRRQASGAEFFALVNYGWGGYENTMAVYLNSTNIIMFDGADHSSEASYAQIIYAK